MARPSISMPDELERRVESQLSYGDSKSEWIRHAMQLRFQVDPVLDRLYDSHQNEERMEFVERAVIDAVNQELQRGRTTGHEDRMDRMPSEITEGEE
jgi:metal-responsive CopG/Arc/MetJ family transcriptional regulator